MKALTEKQQRVYDFIRDTLEQRQTPPTRAEIAEALGFASANAAQTHLRTLAKKGVIELDDRLSRGIRLVEPPDRDEAPQAHNDYLSLAIVGRVAAGAPMLALENVERRCEVDARLFSARPDYLLRVIGDSMTDAGILDGDLLAVHKTTQVRSGQIAVFRWDDEVTVKRYQRDGNTVRLVAANPRYHDLVVDLRREQLAVEGLAVGVIRSL